MGILSWWKGNNKDSSTPSSSSSKLDSAKATVKTDSKMDSTIVSMDKPAGGEEVAGMNGAVEVLRPAPNVDVTVFEFGSVAVSADKVTLAGYCPVSDDFEPCRWEILPAAGSEAPQFRVVF